MFGIFCLFCLFWKGQAISLKSIQQFITPNSQQWPLVGIEDELWITAVDEWDNAINSPTNISIRKTITSSRELLSDTPLLKVTTDQGIIELVFCPVSVSNIPLHSNIIAAASLMGMAWEKVQRKYCMAAPSNRRPTHVSFHHLITAFNFLLLQNPNVNQGFWLNPIQLRYKNFYKVVCANETALPVKHFLQASFGFQITSSGLLPLSHTIPALKKCSNRVSEFLKDYPVPGSELCIPAPHVIMQYMCWITYTETLNTLYPDSHTGAIKNRYGLMPRIRVFDLLTFYSEHCPFSMEHLNRTAFRSSDLLLNVFCPSGPFCTQRAPTMKQIISQMLVDMHLPDGSADGPSDVFSNFGVNLIDGNAWIVIEDRMMVSNNLVIPSDISEWNRGESQVELRSMLTNYEKMSASLPESQNASCCIS